MQIFDNKIRRSKILKLTIRKNFVLELAKYNPLKIVLKENSFKTDSDKIKL